MDDGALENVGAGTSAQQPLEQLLLSFLAGGGMEFFCCGFDQEHYLTAA